MPPLSSTKHVHGTEVMAPRGENRAFLSPHHYAEEFLSLNMQVTSLAVYSLHRLCTCILQL